MPSPEAVIQQRARLHVHTLALIEELMTGAGLEVLPQPAMPGWMDNETKANKQREWINANLELAIAANAAKKGNDNGGS